jgi:hypothetical protein
MRGASHRGLGPFFFVTAALGAGRDVRSGLRFLDSGTTSVSVRSTTGTRVPI